MFARSTSLRLVSRMVVSSRMSGEWLHLSPREREVALLVARGLANKEIARELGLSNGTVKLHVHKIFLKLGTRKRHELIYRSSVSRVNTA